MGKSGGQLCDIYHGKVLLGEAFQEFPSLVQPEIPTTVLFHTASRQSFLYCFSSLESMSLAI